MADSTAPRIRPRPLDGRDQAPDDDGFGAALTAATPALRRFLGHRTPTARDAEDLEQETLERAWRYRASFEDAAEIEPWLRRCALNVWLAWRRREARRPELLGEAAETVADVRAASPETRDSLAVALAPLPELQRQILLRHHRDRLKVRELAAEFGLPANTVKSHLRRARARLARIDDDD